VTRGKGVRAFGEHVGDLVPVYSLRSPQCNRDISLDRTYSSAADRAAYVSLRCLLLFAALDHVLNVYGMLVSCLGSPLALRAYKADLVVRPVGEYVLEFCGYWQARKLAASAGVPSACDVGMQIMQRGKSLRAFFGKDLGCHGLGGDEQCRCGAEVRDGIRQRARDVLLSGVPPEEFGPGIWFAGDPRQARIADQVLAEEGEVADRLRDCAVAAESEVSDRTEQVGTEPPAEDAYPLAPEQDDEPVGHLQRLVNADETV
jgi:hypothetical protein